MKANRLSCWVLAAVLSCSVGENAHGKKRLGQPKDGRALESGFPRIYTANVPLPQGNKFVAALDVLDASRVAVADETVEYTEVTFMVHSKQDLTHIEKLTYIPELRSTPIVLKYNVGKTLGYAQKAKSARDFDGGDDLKQQVYSTISGFPCYRDLAGMEQFMVDLVDQASSIPNLSVTLTDIGDSYIKTQDPTAGYDIWALKITGDGVEAQGLTTEKGVIFAMTGIHAREYAPPELAARAAEELVNGYGNDAEITAMLDHTEVHLVLHVNPDGRYVAETDPSLYRRKNLNGDETQCGEGSFGVDLNRNFPFMWGLDSGSSSYPCSETYRGEAPASEPEVQAIVNYVSGIFPTDQRKPDPEGQIDEPYPETVKGVFFDIHSYGEVIIWPWGHENRETPNDDDLETLVRKYRTFNNYEFAGPNMGPFFAASGATDDWAYGELGAAAMTFELGTEFYQDCAYFNSNIVPSNLPALMYAAKTSRAPYIISKGPDVTSIDLSLSSMENSENSAITVTAEVSDNALSFGNFATAQQSVSSVRLFVDTHPYDVVDGSLPTGIEMSGSFTSGTETATLSLSIADITAETALPLVGRHTIYVQGTDSDGYAGPVTASFFDITDGSPIDECEDSSDSFLVDADLVGTRDCEWLAINMNRFAYLCELVEVGVICPKTCNHCELFD